MISNDRARLVSWILALVAGSSGALGAPGCSSDSGPNTATGGTATTGGSKATGGVTATGGTTGGTAPTTGGVVNTGGTVNTGGVANTGGVVNTGGTSGGAGGTSGAAGMSGGAGGAAAGSASGGASGAGLGGTSGAAGAATGGAAGTAGAAGAAGNGGSGGSGGAANCKGNAVSLAANGTAKASDAAHARVMVDLMTDLPIGNANRTLEFWAYIRSTDWVGETNTIYEYGTQDTTAAGFGLDFGGNAGTIDPYTNGGFDNDNQATGLTTSMDQWVHFAMTWDGTAVRAYVNGAVKSTKAGSGATTMLATVRTQLTIGCNNPRFSCFGGYIDEFRVWSVARSATEIMSNYNKAMVGNEPNLVGYWQFNEASGSSAADSVSTGGHTKHPGTLMSVQASQLPTFVPSTVPITCP